jgi:hypothetical protein
MEVHEILEQCSEERGATLAQLRELCQKCLVPLGFAECVQYGMISYVVPLQSYPPGYHCSPNTPLPFVAIAAQKQHFALYHMGVYATDLGHWLEEEWPQHSKFKLDMGKSCLRFRQAHHIPWELLEILLQRMSWQDWVTVYEKNLNKS